MSLDEPLESTAHVVGGYFTDDSAKQEPSVLILDDTVTRVRRPRDIMSIVLAVLGIVALMLLAVYAQSTTEGVEQDVQAVSHVLSMVLLVPIVVLEPLVTLAIPVAVLTELALRRLGRQVLEAAAAFALGLALAVVFVWAVSTWGSEALIQGMSVSPLNKGTTLTVPGYVAGLCGLLTASGPRTRRRTVNISWNFLWVALGIVLITGQASITGVFVAILLGRVAGLTVRYVSGVSSERAMGQALVKGVRKAGFNPISLVRVDHTTDERALLAPSGSGDAAGATGAFAGSTGASIHDSAVHPLTVDSTNRVYAMHRLDGPRLDVVVLDGDRQLIGVIQRFWRSLRVRGVEGRSAISLRSVAERAALLNYAAQNAGVRTPKLLGVSSAEDSMLLIFEHPENAAPLSEVDPELVTDDFMREAWRQLELAHRAGLAHRGISDDLVLLTLPSSLDPQFPSLSSPAAWLTGWQTGDIASPSLGRHMDCAQMLAMFALKVGPERAIACARKGLSKEDLKAVGPLLQTIIMPNQTRSQLREHKKLIGELRNALVEQVPEAVIEPSQMTRFGVKTILTWAITFVAVTVVFTTIQFDQIVSAISTSNPWWALATFALGLFTWVGAALTFVGFASVKIPLLKATIVQAAASFVALAAPAGIGPAALNLRMLTKRGVSTSLAVATVALVQVSGFVVTILLVVVLSAASGDGGALSALPR